MDDSARAAMPPAPDPASHRVRSQPAARTRSTSVRSGRPRAEAATAVAGKQRSRRRSVGRVNSHAPWAGNRGQRLPQLPEKCRERLAEHCGATYHDERRPCRRNVASGPVRLAQSAAGAISLHRQTQLPTDGEAHTRRILGFSPEHDERRTIDPLAPLEERLKFGAGGQSLMSRKAATQTVNRLRPFARRRFNTFRPPLVFIRSRNP